MEKLACISSVEDNEVGNMTLRLTLITAIQDAADELERRGVDLSYAWKRRDPREPERRAKEAAEDALMLWVRRRFRRQAKRIKERLEMEHPERKAAKLPPGWENILEDAEDEDELALLIQLLTKNTQNGINLFGQSTGIDIDYTITNVEAAEWARKYAYDFIKGIDDTTRQVLQQAITSFVETPGFTIGDIMDMLPFDEQRALRVAVTEVTRTYAQGQQMAGEQLQAEFPDVKIVKRWYTNNDDRVCELCGPLDGTEVELDENFYEPDNSYQDGNPPLHVNCRCWIDAGPRLE